MGQSAGEVCNSEPPMDTSKKKKYSKKSLLLLAKTLGSEQSSRAENLCIVPALHQALTENLSPVPGWEQY